MEPRLVHAPVTVQMAVSTPDHIEHNREYLLLSDLTQDPVGQWLKMAHARGDAQETDPVLLHLLVEMHRKVDRLERLIRGEPESVIALGEEITVDMIGFEHLRFNSAHLSVDQYYYARIHIPTLTNQPIPLFFRALTGELAKIEKIHERDSKEWSAYIFARERMAISEARRA